MHYFWLLQLSLSFGRLILNNSFETLNIKAALEKTQRAWLVMNPSIWFVYF